MQIARKQHKWRISVRLIISAAFSVLILVPLWNLWRLESHHASMFSADTKILTDNYGVDAKQIPHHKRIASNQHLDQSSNKTQLTFYSHTRGDRAGSALLDMIMAHAYAFRHKAHYGGACGTVDYPTLPNQRLLLQTLGLTQVLPFACPTNNMNQDHDHAYRMLEFAEYEQHSKDTFTLEWLQYIRRQRRTTTQKSLENQRTINIAVHVRRGDVTFCSPKVKRYLPNRYYLDLIDQYSPNSTTTTQVNVTIYSNAENPHAHNAHEPRESWTDFTNKGYHVVLGSPLDQVWQEMITANVLIMSKSGFSHVPAIFSDHGQVIYTPYWSEPVPGWTVVPKKKVQKAQMEIRRLQKQYCGAHTVNRAEN